MVPAQSVDEFVEVEIEFLGDLGKVVFEEDIVFVVLLDDFEGDLLLLVGLFHGARGGEQRSGELEAGDLLLELLEFGVRRL